MPTSLLVYEQHIVRSTLQHYLESHSELTVVGEACEVREAVALAQSLRPDLVIMDSWLGGLSAHCAARKIVETCSRTRVLIVSTRGPHNAIENWIRSGISGYLLEESTPDELIRAIDAVLSGKSYLCPAIAHRVLDAAAHPQSSDRAAHSTLTARELEVLQLVAEGRSTKEAATELGIAFRTAEGYRSCAMSKLGIHKVPDLVRYAIREGLIAA